MSYFESSWKMKKINIWKILLATLTTVFLSALVVGLLSREQRHGRSIKEIKNLNVDLRCANHALGRTHDDNESTFVNGCVDRGWNFQNKGNFGGLADIENYVYQVTEDEMRRTRKETVKDMKNQDLQRYFSEVAASERFASRFIVHWMLMGSNNDPGDTDWQHVTCSERHRSTYTVSSGPAGCYYRGGVKIQHDGLYSIYAKLTFTCVEEDNKMKRIFMEIISQEDEKEEQHRVILLRDVQEGNCTVRSDLVTMFQRGVFKLQRGSVIYVRYKAPENVILPSDPYRGYKSNLGVTELTPLNDNF